MCFSNYTNATHTRTWMNAYKCICMSQSSENHWYNMHSFAFGNASTMRKRDKSFVIASLCKYKFWCMAYVQCIAFGTLKKHIYTNVQCKYNIVAQCTYYIETHAPVLIFWNCLSLSQFTHQHDLIYHSNIASNHESFGFDTQWIWWVAFGE